MPRTEKSNSNIEVAVVEKDIHLASQKIFSHFLINQDIETKYLISNQDNFMKSCLNVLKNKIQIKKTSRVITASINKILIEKIMRSHIKKLKQKAKVLAQQLKNNNHFFIRPAWAYQLNQSLEQLRIFNIWLSRLGLKIEPRFNTRWSPQVLRKITEQGLEKISITVDSPPHMQSLMEQTIKISGFNFSTKQAQIKLVSNLSWKKTKQAAKQHALSGVLTIKIKSANLKRQYGEIRWPITITARTRQMAYSRVANNINRLLQKEFRDAILNAVPLP